MREFGVRIALGATSASVMTLVLGSAARVIALGTVIGLACSRALGQVDLDRSCLACSRSIR